MYSKPRTVSAQKLPGRPALRLEQVDENAQRVRKIEAADQHFAIGLRYDNVAIGHRRRTEVKRRTNQFVDSIQLPVHRHGVGIQLRQFQQALHQCRQLIGLLLDRTREWRPTLPDFVSQRLASREWRA